MSAISRTVNPECLPMGGAVSSRFSWAGPRRSDRRLLHAAPSRRQPREHDAQDQRDQRQPAERRHQHRTAHGQPASQMHVVAEEPGGAPCRRERPVGAIAVRFDFGHVVVGTDRHRAERPRVSVGHALVIHRHVEEPGRAQRLAGRLFLQMAAERFLPLVDAEHGLERGGPASSRRVTERASYRR